MRDKVLSPLSVSGNVHRDLSLDVSQNTADAHVVQFYYTKLLSDLRKPWGSILPRIYLCQVIYSCSKIFCLLESQRAEESKTCFIKQREAFLLLSTSN